MCGCLKSLQASPQLLPQVAKVLKLGRVQEVSPITDSFTLCVDLFVLCVCVRARACACACVCVCLCVQVVFALGLTASTDSVLSNHGLL